MFGGGGNPKHAEPKRQSSNGKIMNLFIYKRGKQKADEAVKHNWKKKT